MSRAALLLPLIWPGPVAAESVSFRNDVMAVLSRAGCNSGACHGNLNGKGGFKLSLRGENAEADYLALTRDMLGRRLDLHRPAESVLLAKATMAVPHEGGQRFRRDSFEAKLLHSWVAVGARLDSADGARPVGLRVTPASAILADPTDRVALGVEATFSDGTRRDVTRLACFEPSNLLVKVDPQGVAARSGHGEATVLVRFLGQHAVARLAFIPDRPGFTWKPVPENNFIDRAVFARLKALKVRPAELSTDSEFVRRAHLDTLGLLPTPAEARRFLADAAPDKRERLIDALVERPEFADFWALKWSDLLRNEEKALDAHGVRVFHDWLRRAVAEGRPLNELARELIASRGSTYSRPEANYYRALRDPYTRAEGTAQVFLGLRMQCAKCHNHPFDRWTQTDYHRFAAFFARVDYRIVENNRRDRLDTHEFVGEQVVFLKRTGELKHPASGGDLAPGLLGADTPRFGDTADRLSALADWVARPDNPFFARAQVNRIWQHLVGRGVVDPGDDFRDSNPPSNPELLDALAEEFVKHRFSLKHLARTILRSRVYQLSARAADPDRDDEGLFARAVVRPLQAEQLLDAVAQVTGGKLRFDGFPAGTPASRPASGRKRRRGRGRRRREVSRRVRQARAVVEFVSANAPMTRRWPAPSRLITGPAVHRLLTEPDNRLGQLLASGKSAAALLDELYLAALSRPPAAARATEALAVLAKASDRRARAGGRRLGACSTPRSSSSGAAPSPRHFRER
ncbi:MAG: DUF1549 and DUF1553 domain-containing protein [Gemmataceae bacterium]